MFLDFGRKPQYVQKSHTDTKRTYIGTYIGFKPGTFFYCEATVQTIDPPC